MPPIPEPLYKQADHPRLKVNEWRPEQGAERINDFILMSSSVTNSYVVTTAKGDVVINTGMPDHAARHRERFEQLLRRPLKVKKIVFTQDHMDQTGGWETFNDPGADLADKSQMPLESVMFAEDKIFGVQIRTQWDLFQVARHDRPAQRPVDRFGRFLERSRSGDWTSPGSITATTSSESRENTTGMFNSYFIYDHGTDDLGSDRMSLEPAARGAGA